ncbi:MAG: L,D-transpeptidase family protein [Pseudolabrys sp.]
MRNTRLLAGTILALATALPGIPVLAAPNSLRSAPPPPATLRGQPIRGHVQTLPAPAATPVAPRTQAEPAQERAQERVQEPVQERTQERVQAQPAPAAVENSGVDIKGAIERLFAAGDSQISDKLRDLVAARHLEKFIARQSERAAAETFYKSRNFAPLWVSDGRLTSRAKATIARLRNAGAEGLNPADYPVPEFPSFGSPEALAEGDVKLTNSVLDFARHLQTGRIAPTRVSAEVDYGASHAPDPADILRKVSDASDINATFDGFNPPEHGFRALKDKLAALRANASAEQPVARIADGPLLKVGMKDARVPQLRARLGVEGKADDMTYDLRLSNAVKRVQARANISGKGMLDGKTLAAINGPKPGQQAETIEANMERWRWLPRDLGRTYVMVNVPDFTLKVVRDNNVVWRTKIVAGKPQTPTPLLTAAMDNVLVNPSWYVPQSIIQNELLPLYANDPKVFDRMGLEVKKGPDGNINVVQPPGAANALGRIKFNFPNKFQVYLHDTPEKRLFAADRRAFSHGCMRVEDPTKFGEVMLHLAMNGPTPNSQQINAMFGHEEKTFKLQNRPMVHLTYQTAYVDEDGKLVIRDDLYGFDARIHKVLTTEERKVADVAPPIDPKREQATAKSNQEILRWVERREAGNPFAFFERIFR